MLRACWIACLLMGNMAWTQTKPASSADTPNSPSTAGPPDSDTQKPPSTTAISGNVPVLTINGLCAQLTPAAGEAPAKSVCQTVVTRAQFESLIDALQAGQDAQDKRRFAKAYPQFVVMAHEAEKRGLDKQPRFGEKLEFARIQMLSQELMAQIRAEAAQVPERDIQDYYRQNASEFEVANLERVVIPGRTQVKSPSKQLGVEQGQAAEDVMTKEAVLLRLHAAAGADFATLQKQAYAAAGIGGNNPPNPKMDKMRRRSLPPAHASAFDLKPGQVSPVISDATGHYIYKLDWKGIEPLDAVKQEISNTLRAQRVRKMVQSLEQPFTTEVNEAYFGAEEKGSPTEEKGGPD